MNARHHASMTLDEIRQGYARERRLRERAGDVELDIVTLDGVNLDECHLVVPEDEYERDDGIRIPILKGIPAGASVTFSKASAE